MTLSVIIPAYNEERRIEKTLLAVSDYFKRQSYASEIIVVDDGSVDRTIQVVERLRANIPNLRLIRVSPNAGKGAAVKAGMLQARGAFRLFSDADLSVSIEQLETLWSFAEQDYDVVIGSIGVSGSEIRATPSIFRSFAGQASKWVTRALLPPIRHIRDTQRGFKLFTARATEIIFPRLTIERWLFDVEALLIAAKCGLRIKEVPVLWSNSSDSRVNLKSYGTAFRELSKICITLYTGGYNS